MSKEETGDRSLTKAPLIIFGTMVLMSIVSIAFVFVSHYKRSEPYLDSKLRKVRYQTRAPRTTLSLNYSAFGPQVLAHELIGFQFWQWQASGRSDPSSSFDIKVVVYKNISEEEVAAKFPVLEKKFMDYRYLRYADAVEYLSATLVELEADNGIDVDDIRSRLRATRDKIVSHFR